MIRSELIQKIADENPNLFQRDVERIVNTIFEEIIHAIAAGIIYFIGTLYKLEITKQDVKNITNVSEVTINKCYKKLDLTKEKIVPPQILVKLNERI